jgi:hypothetical protein
VFYFVTLNCISLANDDFSLVNLPAHFTVWLASPEAAFLNGKFVWSNWDVDELKARKDEITSASNLTLGLLGWS